MEWLQKTCPSLNNGVAFCSGSFSARKDNDLIQMTKKYGHLFHFVHLRNTRVLDDGSFYETGHIDGGVNMPLLMKTLQEEMKKRITAGRTDYRIPMRPDHGINILGDFNLKANPGYPLIGRLKGMAELSGIEEALLRI
jgi:mannonate dehydratase